MRENNPAWVPDDPFESDLDRHLAVGCAAQALFDLFRRHQREQSHPRPATFDLVVERGQGIAGSPATVTQFLSSQLDETLCNYFVGQFAFGDLTRDEALRSIGLFAEEVMPKLRGKTVETGKEAATA